MPPKEPTRHQLSSRLAYKSQTPSFLVKLQNQVAGRATEDDDDEPQYLDGIDEFGRERRPPIPERPEDDKRGSDDEDDVDEKPLVVVLKEGKHLTELEVKNERRKAQGLPPLPPESESSEPLKEPTPGEASKKLTDAPSGLSFSSKKNKEGGTTGSKRKAPDGSSKSEDVRQNPKKSRKSKKGLLSFDRDDMG
ncbi:hypothetical protein JB92DRAFT_3138459 [Gautieria morchelliformis]|nr:hypothetical protein JB92DRAFT_3138459 [Gautieria morchelliformis]